MRIVHNHEKLLPHVNALKASGNALEFANSRLDVLVLYPQSQRSADCREDVVHVNFSDQR